ncbi:MAG: preprotein translocase subunit SecG [Prevotellaceae bacterium]|jgi:preprotein translocase subunit SecG|nr:preprotein translocase subunit SecG [Prevotellaceae bacterium]
MGYMIFAVLLIIVGLLMIFAVLIQNSKGGGLAANFASGNQTFGVRQTADFIEKFTWYLITVLFVFCFLSSASIPDNVVVNNRHSSVQERIQSYTPGVFPVTGSETDSSDSIENGEISTTGL